MHFAFLYFLRWLLQWTPVFIVFRALFFKMFIKLTCNIRIFIHFSIIICVNVFSLTSRICFSFMFRYLLFLLSPLLLCVFVNALHVSHLFTNFNDYNSSLVYIFVHVHVNIDKDATCFQSNNNDTDSKDLWSLFLASLLFLNV